MALDNPQQFSRDQVLTIVKLKNDLGSHVSQCQRIYTTLISERQSDCALIPVSEDEITELRRYLGKIALFPEIFKTEAERISTYLENIGRMTCRTPK